MSSIFGLFALPEGERKEKLAVFLLILVLNGWIKHTV
jgi:hypothetical protein